ncbi:MAG: type II toxin-antitoxin system VapC family toxin [Cyanobium sp. CZS 25K]|nr:type II toxin-antitoxin system VapC family toxin [Cyanobium sp. CZS25K]
MPEQSPQALDWFEQCQGTLISSALGFKHRHHGLSHQPHQAVVDPFERLLPDPGLGLRAGDAVPLAVALHSPCSQLASFDRRRQQAARGLGLSPALS